MTRYIIRDDQIEEIRNLLKNRSTLAVRNILNQLEVIKEDDTKKS